MDSNSLKPPQSLLGMPQKFEQEEEAKNDQQPQQASGPKDDSNYNVMPDEMKKSSKKGKKKVSKVMNTAQKAAKKLKR